MSLATDRPRAQAVPGALSAWAGHAERAALGLAAVALAGMAAAIAWQVFARFVLNDSPSWAEPLAQLLLLWCVVLGTAAGVRAGFHLGLQGLAGALPERAAQAVRSIALLAVALFGVLMAWHGLGLARFTAGHVIAGLGISRAAAYVPFVLGGLLVALFAVERLVANTGSGGGAWPAATESDAWS